MRALLTSLARLHAHGVIHRDIKPSNFLHRFRSGEYALIDLGLAHMADASASLDDLMKQSLKNNKDGSISAQDSHGQKAGMLKEGGGSDVHREHEGESLGGHNEDEEKSTNTTSMMPSSLGEVMEKGTGPKKRGRRALEQQAEEDSVLGNKSKDTNTVNSNNSSSHTGNSSNSTSVEPPRKRHRASTTIDLASINATNEDNTTMQTTLQSLISPSSTTSSSSSSSASSSSTHRVVTHSLVDGTISGVAALISSRPVQDKDALRTSQTHTQIHHSNSLTNKPASPSSPSPSSPTSMPSTLPPDSLSPPFDALTKVSDADLWAAYLKEVKSLLGGVQKVPAHTPHREGDDGDSTASTSTHTSSSSHSSSNSSAAKLLASSQPADLRAKAVRVGNLKMNKDNNITNSITNNINHGLGNTNPSGVHNPGTGLETVGFAVPQHGSSLPQNATIEDMLLGANSPIPIGTAEGDGGINNGNATVNNINNNNSNMINTMMTVLKGSQHQSRSRGAVAALAASKVAATTMEKENYNTSNNYNNTRNQMNNNTNANKGVELQSLNKGVAAKGRTLRGEGGEGREGEGTTPTLPPTGTGVPTVPAKGAAVSVVGSLSTPSSITAKQQKLPHVSRAGTRGFRAPEILMRVSEVG